MHKIGFDSAKYIKEQTKYILERVKTSSGRLYIECGGKLLHDKHASRVLPGFDENNKMKVFKELKEHLDIIICIYAGDIEQRKIRGDFGISYDADVLKMIHDFASYGLKCDKVVITRFENQVAAVQFKRKLEQRGIKVYEHTATPGYPSDIDVVVSEEGYGKNPYIPVDAPVVIVTAPGPGSGKLATCLNQMYHEAKMGQRPNYAKLETFPIWNIPLKHPVNLAYEAATADLNDVNMIDPFHLEAYGETTVNYNRDVEIFPVLSAIFERIFGACPYQSPTDMGVNMAGNCIIDDEVCREASRQEIIRRYYQALAGRLEETSTDEEVFKLELLMKQAGISPENRKVTVAAKERAEETGGPAAAIELEDGRIITGKTSDLLGASAALLLNTLKELAGIQHKIHVISPVAIEPIQKLKTEYLGSKNPRLHTDEVLIALSSSAATSDIANLALEQLPRLKGCQVHSSVMLSSVDKKIFKKLGVQLTTEPVYEHKKLY